MGILEGGKGEKGTEEILEIIMTKNFTKLVSGAKPHFHKAQRTPRRINAAPTKINKNKNKKPPTLRHIIFKM